MNCRVFGCVEHADHHVTWPGVYTAPDGEAWVCEAHADAFLRNVEGAHLLMSEERRRDLGDRYAREALIDAESGE